MKFLLAIVLAVPLLAQSNFSTAPPSLGSNPITETMTVGTGGVTINTLVQMDLSSPSKIVAAATGAYGVAMNSVAAGGTVEVARYGTVPCVTDTGGAVAGHLATIGTGTIIDCADTGQLAASGVPITSRIVGVFRSNASGGATASLELTPAYLGTALSLSSLPSIGSHTALCNSTGLSATPAACSPSTLLGFLQLQWANAFSQKFFGAGAPGTISGNEPGDLYFDTPNSNVYGCLATAGTSPPACTTVAPSNWVQLNGAGGSMVYPGGGIPNSTGTAWGTSYSLQGNGTKVQLSTGATVTNDCVKFDANGNTVDAGAGCGGGGSATFTLSNAGTTGTTANTLTKATAGTAIIAATSDTNGIVGITTSGAGTSGSATITYAGPVSCAFDGATTQNDYVQISPTVAGDCNDAGATPPAGVQIIGRVWSTHASAGTYSIELYPATGPPVLQGTGMAFSSSAAGITAAVDPNQVSYLTSAIAGGGGSDTVVIAPQSGASTNLVSTTLTSAVFTAFQNGQALTLILTTANNVGSDTLTLAGVGPYNLTYEPTIGAAPTAVLANQLLLKIPYPITFSANCNGVGGGSACIIVHLDGISLGTNYATGGGSANAQTATYSPAIGALAVGAQLYWLPVANNTTTTPTFSPNGLTAKTLVKVGGAALAASDLTTTAIAWAIYDGTNWELQNPQTSSASGITGTLTSGTVPKATGSSTLGNSSITDNGTAVATTEPFSAASVSTGSSPPSLGSVTGAFGMGEAATSVTPVASADFMQALSTTHWWQCSENNAAVHACNPGLPASSTVGDIGYFSDATGHNLANLAGNTAATDKVVVSHGTGSASQAPTLSNAPALSAANMTSFPTLNQNTSGSAATATTSTNVAGGAAGEVPYQTGVGATGFTAAGTAKQVGLSGGTGAPTFIDFPIVLDIPAANTNGSTAGTGWSLPASAAPTVAARAGTNNLGGVLQFADANNAQFDIEIPGDADLTSGNYPYIKLFFTDGANTTGTEIFQAQVSCYVSDFSATDDVAFATAQVFTTRTATAANRSGSENLQFNSTSMSGCVVGGSMIVKITRNTDTAASVVNVSKATITFPRLLTQQAN